LAQTAGQPVLSARARINAGWAALHIGEPQNAKGWLDEAFDQIQHFPPSYDQANGLINLALAYAEPDTDERELRKYHQEGLLTDKTDRRCLGEVP
jgi:hypothetical protein